MSYFFQLFLFIILYRAEVYCWNVAEGKDAMQTQSLKEIYNWGTAFGTESFPEPNLADNCVDGITNDDESSKSCCGVKGGDDQNYWEVNLGGNYAIDFVKVYSSQQERSAINDLVINVYTKQESYAECGRVDNNIPNASIREVFCSYIIVARKVLLKKSGSSHIRMCEVEVNALYRVCDASNGEYFYGRECSSACNCVTQCDYTTGVCEDECKNSYTHDTEGLCIPTCDDGMFGIQCDNECNCKNETEVCDKHTGFCEECADEFFNDCKTRVISESDIRISYINGIANFVNVTVDKLQYHVMSSLVEIKVVLRDSNDIITSLNIDMESRISNSGVVEYLINATSFTVYVTPFVLSIDNVLYEGTPLFTTHVGTFSVDPPSHDDPPINTSSGTTHPIPAVTTEEMYVVTSDEKSDKTSGEKSDKTPVIPTDGGKADKTSDEPSDNIFNMYFIIGIGCCSLVISCVVVVVYCLMKRFLNKKLDANQGCNDPRMGSTNPAYVDSFDRLGDSEYASVYEESITSSSHSVIYRSFEQRQSTET